MRGQARDFDDWEGEHGCRGRAYRDVFTVFKRQERNRGFGGEFHGNDGPLNVAVPTPKLPINTWLIDAARTAGHTYDAQIERCARSLWYGRRTASGFSWGAKFVWTQRFAWFQSAASWCVCRYGRAGTCGCAIQFCAFRYRRARTAAFGFSCGAGASDYDAFEITRTARAGEC